MQEKQVNKKVLREDMSSKANSMVHGPLLW